MYIYVVLREILVDHLDKLAVVFIQTSSNDLGLVFGSYIQYRSCAQKDGKDS